LALAAARTVAPQPTARRLSRLHLAQAFVIASFIALVTIRFLVAPLDENDEGVVVTKAMLVLLGHVPYRDFFATYGPLDTYLLAGAFKLVTANIVVERVLGVACLVATGGVAYLVFSLIGLKGSMRVLLSGLIAVAPLSVPAFNSAFLANLVGLISVYFFLSSLRHSSALRAGIAGGLTGIASFARPEFAVALAAGLLLGYAVLAIRSRGEAWWMLAAYLGGMLVASAACWAPLTLAAGVNPVWVDLVRYPLEFYPKGRNIPFGQGREGVIVITFAIAFAAVWITAAIRAYRRRDDALEIARIVGLLVAGVALFTWVRTRADGIHAFDAWPVTAVLLGLLLQPRLARRRMMRLDAIAGITGILMFSLAVAALAYRDWLLPHAQAGVPRSGISGERAWMPVDMLATLTASIDRRSRPGQPIWIGLHRNDLVTYSDTMLYFLADRPPGTVYDEAFPGLTNSEPTERLITCQLSSSGVRLVVLGPNPPPEPWNLSAVAGSNYLDRWLAQHTQARTSVGPYELLTLTPDVRPDDRCSSSGGAALGQESRAARGTSPASAGSGAPGSAAS
jgi:hypothetical protein